MWTRFCLLAPGRPADLRWRRSRRRQAKTCPNLLAGQAPASKNVSNHCAGRPAMLASRKDVSKLAGRAAVSDQRQNHADLGVVASRRAASGATFGRRTVLGICEAPHTATLTGPGRFKGVGGTKIQDSRALNSCLLRVLLASLRPPSRFSLAKNHNRLEPQSGRNLESKKNRDEGKNNEKHARSRKNGRRRREKARSATQQRKATNSLWGPFPCKFQAVHPHRVALTCQACACKFCFRVVDMFLIGRQAPTRSCKTAGGLLSCTARQRAPLRWLQRRRKVSERQLSQVSHLRLVPSA